jgi:hypothetical protein
MDVWQDSISNGVDRLEIIEGFYYRKLLLTCFRAGEG